MRRKIAACAAAALVALSLALAARQSDAKNAPAASADERRKELDAFNARFLEAHLKMDTPGILEAWSEDGVSLLPETVPPVGKPAIAIFLAGVTEQLKGWRMEKMELDFQGIEVSGDWASEWAYEHQMVRPPEAGKPVFDGHGKMLLKLNHEAGGAWKIKREMWNQGEKP